MFGDFGIASKAAVAVLVAGFVGTVAVHPARAHTIGFDYSGSTSTTAFIGGTGGVMNFTLSFGAPAGETVDGNFSLEALNKNNVIISDVELLGFSFNPGTIDYGDTTIPPNGSVFDFSFTDVMKWAVTAGAGDLSPLTLIITSTLAPSANFGPFKPVLSVDLTGDLHVLPLPAALPMFAGGLATLGFLVRQRRRRPSAAPAGDADRALSAPR